jgi:membrane dipeptidase
VGGRRMNARLALAVLAAGAAVAAAPAAEDAAARAARVHQDAIVVDTHQDVPEALEEKWGGYADWHDIGEPGSTKHVDLPRLKQGGVTAPFFVVYVPASYAESGGSARYALELSDMVDAMVARHPAELMAAASVADIRRAKGDGRIAILKGIEGGHAIEDSMGALRGFYRLGVRYMTLTHTNTNHWADSAGNFFAPDYDAAKHQVHHGLSEFGRAVVREMNRLGMMVDVSHVSTETVDDALEASRAPVFASHSSCRALSDIPRNLTDDQIKRIAAKGGVVMINVSSIFLDQSAVDHFKGQLDRIRPQYAQVKEQYKDDPERRTEELDKVMKGVSMRTPTDWTKAVDHIERVIRIAGPDAVGLGTDYDGIPDPPAGLEDVSKLPRITEELLRRGHTEEQVRKVLGENFLRFFSKVEEVSRSLSAEPPSLAQIPPAK